MRIFPYLLGDLKRLMQNMVAFRTGTFPKNQSHFTASLADTPDLALLQWLTGLQNAEILEQRATIATKVNAYVTTCVDEIAPLRK